MSLSIQQLLESDPEALTQLPYETLAHALYAKGKRDGYQKITDKTKWREAVTASKIAGHTAHAKISAGAKSPKYGSDAFDEAGGKMAEYKSIAVDGTKVRNLLRKTQTRKGKGNTRYAPLAVGGVYNGAYTHDAIDKYALNDHYFSIFFEELCVLIIKPNTDVVIAQLRTNLDKTLSKTGRKTTNLNTVTINLVDDRASYDVAYINRQWWEDMHGVFDYLV